MSGPVKGSDAWFMERLPQAAKDAIANKPQAKKHLMEDMRKFGFFGGKEPQPEDKSPEPEE